MCVPWLVGVCLLVLGVKLIPKARVTQATDLKWSSDSNGLLAVATKALVATRCMVLHQKFSCHCFALLVTSTGISQMLKLCFCAFKDRVVDDLNPVLNFTRKEVESLLHFVEEEPEAEKILLESLAVYEPVISQACQLYPRLISKVLLQ